MKTQVIVDKKNKKVICTQISNGRTHDFKLYKESGVQIRKDIKSLTDTGFLGIKALHENSELPVKSSKYHKLSKEEKTYNRSISRMRVANEHAIGFLKRFAIIADKYRNRRKRFGLRFNLIAGICNFDISA